MKTLVMDAMGVIYASGDDVVELLCPFIHENGGITDDRRIEALYHDASLGRFPSKQFWEQVQVDPALEEVYLLRHRLSAGVFEFLSRAKPRLASIWCLSNDVSEWSRKLRERFELSRLIQGFVISGDVGARKPDEAIFERLLFQTGVNAKTIVFVDDRPQNLDAAVAFGLQTVLFGSARGKHSQHRATTDFAQLLNYVCSDRT